MKRVTLSITNRCNSRCVHCYEAPERKSRQSREMPVSLISILFEESAALGATEVVLIGGEPFLRGDLVEIVTNALDVGLRVGISTNGLCVTDDMLSRLRHLPLWFLSISLFGVSSEIHDSMTRVNGASELSMGVLRRALKMGLPATVAIPVCALNYDHVRQSVRALYEDGVGCVTLLYVTPAGAGHHLKDMIIPPVQWRAWVDALSVECKQNYGGRLFQAEPIVARNTGELEKWATAGYTGECRGITNDTVFVSSGGQVLPCSFYPAEEAVALWQPGALERILASETNWPMKGMSRDACCPAIVVPGNVCCALRKFCPSLRASLEETKKLGYSPLCPFEIIPSDILIGKAS